MIDMAITMPQLAQLPLGDVPQAQATEENAVDFGTLLTQAQETQQTEENATDNSAEKTTLVRKGFRDKSAELEPNDAFQQAQYTAWMNIVQPVEVLLASEDGEVNPAQLLEALTGIEDETAAGQGAETLLLSLIEAEEPEADMAPETGAQREVTETKLETVLLDKPVADAIPAQAVEEAPTQVEVAETPLVDKVPAQAETKPALEPVAQQQDIQPQDAEQPILQDATAVAPRPPMPDMPFVQQELDVEAPTFTQMVAQAVEQQTSEGTTQFDIALYPKELGKVTVNVQIVQGQATLSFICENARAQNILNAHAGAIGSLIEQNTGREVVVEVPQQENTGQQSYEGHGGNQQRQDEKPQHPRKEQVSIFIDQLKASMLVG